MIEQEPAFFVGEYSEDINELSVAGGGIDDVADRVMHPAAGEQNPQRGEEAADGCHPDREEMHALRDAPFTEDPDADEDRLEEESDQCFYGEQCAEDIADEARILRPVHAELEFLHQPGDHAHAKVDQKEFAPKFCHAPPAFFAGAVIHGLEDGDEPDQPEGEGHEQKVQGGGDAKLDTREGDNVHTRPLRIYRDTFHKYCAKYT